MPTEAGPGPAAPTRRARRLDVGIELIVAYKAVKAVLQLALAATLVVLAATGEIGYVRELVHHLREHVTSRWSLAVARALAAITSPRGLHLLELALLLDGSLTAIEGWSLWRGYRWGPWLVVLATATPLPLELRAVWRHPHPSRMGLVAVNLAIVAYLAWRIARRAPGATVAPEA